MTVPKLNQGNLKNIQITVPSLPEQKRIVAILVFSSYLKFHKPPPTFSLPTP
jgi:restriction endonuclease S subunit